MTIKMEKIAELLQSGNNIAILPHISPDGDCLGSAFALQLALKKINKNPTVILEDNIPKGYNFLQGQSVHVDELDSDAIFDVLICLDSSDEERLGKRISLVQGSLISINLDHHITNTQYAQYNFVDANAAATGELVYRLIQALTIELDDAIAENLYVAIATDTGGFRYSNTTSATHLITAALLDVGIDVAGINRKVFETVTLQKLNLLSKAVEKLELYDDNRIAVLSLTKEMMKNSGADDDDMDGLSGLPRSIAGVEVGVILKEKDVDTTKVSFRSNEYVDVSEIAGLFNGGGHKRASGCTLRVNMHTAKKQILEAVSKVLLPNRS